MKRSLETFEDLVARARTAHAPPLDTTDRVMARLRTSMPPEPVDRTMAWCTAAALAASVVFTVWGYDAWSTLSDPLNGLLCQTEMVLE